MNISNRNPCQYIHESLANSEKITGEIDMLQYYLDGLMENVFMDIIDGWSTGDKLLDFVLVACNGVYDPYILCMQYRRLHQLGLRVPSQRIIVVQQAEYDDEENGPLILRNVYLATLRKAEFDFDINNLSIHLPVEPKYFFWREFINNNYLANGHKIVNQKWLTVGPLYNQYCNYGFTDLNGDTIFVPENGVCNVELLPILKRDSLFLEYGIDSDMLTHLHRTWIRDKSKS